MTSQSRHLNALREFSCADIMGDPIGRARSMVEHNNTSLHVQLDHEYTVITAPDDTRWIVAWVFDTARMPGADSWYGPDPGGETVVCWWAPLPPPCDACDGQGDVPHYGGSDEILGYSPCPVCKPPKER